ncbi:MAG: DMT family transporter, partial [Nitrospinota bacterium]
MGLLLGGVFALSWASILIRLCEAPPLVIALYRMGLATLLLAPGFAWARGRRGLALAWSFGPGLLLAGLFLGLHFALWVSSLFHTSVASSVFFVTTHPLWVAFAARWLFGEKVGRPLIFAVGLTTVGGAVTAWGDWGESGSRLYGNGLALGGALMMAGYLLVGRRLRPKVALFPYGFFAYGGAALVLFLLTAWQGLSLAPYPGQTFLFLFLLALGPTLLGHSALNWALRHLASPAVALAVVGEPVLASLLAWGVLGEGLTPARALGGGLMAAGVALG